MFSVSNLKSCTLLARLWNYIQTLKISVTLSQSVRDSDHVAWPFYSRWLGCKQRPLKADVLMIQFMGVRYRAGWIISGLVHQWVLNWWKVTQSLSLSPARPHPFSLFWQLPGECLCLNMFSLLSGPSIWGQGTKLTWTDTPKITSQNKLFHWAVFLGISSEQRKTN